MHGMDQYDPVAVATRIVEGEATELNDRLQAGWALLQWHEWRMTQALAGIRQHLAGLREIAANQEHFGEPLARVVDGYGELSGALQHLRQQVHLQLIDMGKYPLSDAQLNELESLVEQLRRDQG